MSYPLSLLLIGWWRWVSHGIRLSGCVLWGESFFSRLVLRFIFDIFTYVLARGVDICVGGFVGGDGVGVLLAVVWVVCAWEFGADVGVLAC